MAVRIRLVIDRFDIEPYDATTEKGDRVRITSSADEEVLSLDASVAEPGDGFDDGRRLAETRTQKHRRANLPRRTSAFSSRHDDNV